MPDKFGGIEVEDTIVAPAVDKFGGIPVEESIKQSSVARGGIGRNVTDPEERQTLAAGRLVQRNRDAGKKDLFLPEELGLDPKEFGHVVSLGNTTTTAYSAIKGLAKGSSFNISEALSKLAKQNLLSEDQQQALARIEEENKDLEAGFEAVGAALPTGKIATAGRSGSGLWQGLKQAFTTGGKIGLVSGAAGAIGEKGKESTLGDIAEKATTQGLTTGLTSTLFPLGASALRGGSKLAESIRQTVNPESAGMLERALRFSTNLGKRTDQIVKDSLESIKEHGGIDVKDLDTGITAAKQAKQTIWGQFRQLLDPNQNEVVDTSKKFFNIADEIINKDTGLSLARDAEKNLPSIRRQLDKIRSSVQQGKTLTRAQRDKISELSEQQSKYQAASDQFGGQLKEIEDLTKVYGKEYALDQAEHQIQSWNDQLESLMKQRNLSSKNLAGEPVLNVQDKFRQALKDDLLSKLGSLTGKDKQAIQKLRRQYGSLVEFEEAAIKRAVVSGRQAPINLPQTLQMAEGIGEGATTLAGGETLRGLQQMVVRPAVATVARTLNDPNDLIRRAFEKNQAPISISGRVIKRLSKLEPLDQEAALGAAIANVVRINPKNKPVTQKEIDAEIEKILNRED